MKLSGSYAFDIASQNVFDALLDPSILQSSIPGCVAAWHADENHMKVRLMLPLPLPGLEGPYDVSVRVKEQEPPRMLLLLAERRGRIGGTVETLTHITLTDKELGTSSLLAYETQGKLEGPIAAADNPLIQQIIVHSLNTFFKNLNAILSQTAHSRV